jgi:hypothetical protein
MNRLSRKKYPVPTLMNKPMKKRASTASLKGMLIKTLSLTMMMTGLILMPMETRMAQRQRLSLKHLQRKKSILSVSQLYIRSQRFQRRRNLGFQEPHTD